MSQTRYKTIAYVSTLTALAVLLRFFEIPYPLLTWLKYDASGVPLAILAYMGWSLLAYSLPAYYLVSVALGADFMGMAMKVVAEASTIIPLVYSYRRLKTRRKLAVSLSTGAAALSRVVVMHLFNVLITPYWLVYSYGMDYETALSYVYSIVLLIDVFNLTIAVPVSLAAIYVAEYLLKTGILHEH